MAENRGGKYIEWIDGRPVPRYSEPVTKQEMTDLIVAAVAVPYERKADDSEDYSGMSKLEVAQHKVADRAANGDLDALNFIYDRSIGKPKQVSENLNVTVNLNDFLDSLPPPESIEYAEALSVAEISRLQITAHEYEPIEETIDLTPEQVEELLEGC